MIAMSLLLVRFTLHHNYGQTISVSGGSRIISEHKNARFEVFQYNNGSKELWITLPGQQELLPRLHHIGG